MSQVNIVEVNGLTGYFKVLKPTPTPAPGIPMEWIAGIVILAVVIIAAVAYYIRR